MIARFSGDEKPNYFAHVLASQIRCKECRGIITRGEINELREPGPNLGSNLLQLLNVSDCWSSVWRVVKVSRHMVVAPSPQVSELYRAEIPSEG